jgi:hypothetical protein
VRETRGGEHHQDGGEDSAEGNVSVQQFSFCAEAAGKVAAFGQHGLVQPG